jgi:hypothetical protein
LIKGGSQLHLGLAVEVSQAGLNRQTASQGADSAVFADTLSIELAMILLYGRIKLGYAISNRSDSSECYFNAVM